MKVNKLLLICSLGLLFFGCDSKDVKALQEEIDDLQSEVDNLREANERLINEKNELEMQIIELSLERTVSSYSGPELKTVVTQAVDARLLPDNNSMKLDSFSRGDSVIISGFSDKKETIDGFEGYWLKVDIKNYKLRDGYETHGTGWIFSKYVKIDQSVNVSTMKVLSTETDKYGSLILNLEFDRGGVKSIVKISPDKIDGLDGYYFTWHRYSDEFNYSDPIGTFKWNPEKNELTHCSIMGHDMDACCFVSDDERFFFQEAGTSPGSKAISVFDNKTAKQLFHGSYLRPFEIDGKSIVIVDYSSEDAKARIEEYKKTLDPKDLKSHKVLARYKLDLETLNTTFIDCVLSYVQ